MRFSAVFFVLGVIGSGVLGYVTSRLSASGDMVPGDGAQGAAPHAASKKEVLILGNAPQFALTDSRGESFRSESLGGKVWVLNFFFTSCEGPCPKMNAELVRLANEFNGRVNFLSITSDPKNDTPAVLAEYKKKMGGENLSWTLLTGAEQEIVRIANKGFGFAADEPSLHTTRFILVDQSGRVRGYFSSDLPEEVAKLRETLSHLLETPS